ncbi:collagen alpha-6(VI) chain-like [Styela clava]
MVIRISAFLFITLSMMFVVSANDFAGISGCRATKLDLVFVVDGSTPDFQYDFGYVRMWIQNITSHFDISPFTTRIAVVQSGDTPYTEFDFEAFDSIDKVLGAVNNIQFGTGTSTAGDTLRYVKDHVTSHARKGAAVMLIVLSDGIIRKHKDVRRAAEKLHDMGVTTFAVGAGESMADHRNVEYLKTIASDPMQRHLFVVQNLRNVGTLEHSILQEICKSTIQECPTAPHDLAFIIDGSSTIGYDNFEKVKQWMKRMVEAFHVSPESTRVAVLQYSTDVQEEISFNDNLTKAEVLDKIGQMQLLIGDTHTGHALEYCMKVIFADTYGSRNNVPDVVIVMTDGKAQDHEHVVHAAKLVHDAGIEVYAMGIGDHYSLEEIKDIASDPDENHVILANGFQQIDLQRIGLIKKICVESEPGCPHTAAEIVFLVDNQMIREENTFQNVKTWIKSVVDSLEVGPHYSRISLVRYGRVSDVLFRLSSHSSTSQVINAISRQFNYQTEDTNELSATGRAIDYAKSVIFGQARKNVPKFLVVLSGGNSQDDFVPAVTRTRKSGIDIFAVGIGEVNQDNLQRLAVSENHVFHDETFDGIRGKLGGFISAVCAVSEPICSVQEIDLQFVVDASDNITLEDFEKVKRWIRNVIRSFDIGFYTTRIGFTQYSTYIRNEFDMNTYKTRREIEHALLEITPIGGTMLKTDFVLQYVMNHSFAEAAGSRDGASKVLVIVSDGNSEDSIDEEINKIHESGIRVFAVGAGKQTNRAFLENLATEPVVTHVTESSSYDAINTIRQQVVGEICRETKSECPEAEMDLIFLVDGSTTTEPENFQLVKEWLISFVQQFEIGEYNSKIGLIQYADLSRLDIDLRYISDKKTLVDAIVNLKPLTGESFTGSALEYVREQGFSDKNGERRDTPKVVIVLTDGESSDSVEIPAKVLHDDGVIVYAVGVRKSDENELRSISSSEENVFHVKNYDAISTIHSSLVRRVCQKVQIDCRENATDVVLLIDGSYSVGHSDWEVVKSFMINITQRFEIGPNAVQVGVVQYASQQRIEFALKDYNDSSALHGAIRNLKWMMGDTHTAEALGFARQYALTPEAGARGSNVSKMLIIVTDGDPQDSREINEAAAAIRAAGWRVFAIGVGQATLSELHILASKPVLDHVFHADDFESTRNLKGRLFRMICTERLVEIEKGISSERKGMALETDVPDIHFDVFSDAENSTAVSNNDNSAANVDVTSDQGSDGEEGLDTHRSVEFDILGDDHRTAKLRDKIFDVYPVNETGRVGLVDPALDKRLKHSPKENRSIGPGSLQDNISSRSPVPYGVRRKDVDGINCPKLKRENKEVTTGWNLLRVVGIIPHKRSSEKVSIKPKRSTLLNRFVEIPSRLRAVRIKPGSSLNHTSFRVTSKVALIGPLSQGISNLFDESWRISSVFRMHGATTKMQWTLINITDDSGATIFSVALNGDDHSLKLRFNDGDDVQHIEIKGGGAKKLFDKNFHKIEISSNNDSQVSVKVDCITIGRNLFQPFSVTSSLYVGTLVSSEYREDDHVIVDVQEAVLECNSLVEEQCCELKGAACDRNEDAKYKKKHEDETHECDCPPGPRGPPGPSSQVLRRAEVAKVGPRGPPGKCPAKCSTISKSTVKRIAKKVATDLIENEIKKMYGILLESINEDGRMDPSVIQRVLTKMERKTNGEFPDKETETKSNNKHRRRKQHVVSKKDCDGASCDSIPDEILDEIILS